MLIIVIHCAQTDGSVRFPSNGLVSCNLVGAQLAALPPISAAFVRSAAVDRHRRPRAQEPTLAVGTAADGSAVFSRRTLY